MLLPAGAGNTTILFTSFTLFGATDNTTKSTTMEKFCYKNHIERLNNRIYFVTEKAMKELKNKYTFTTDF